LSKVEADVVRSLTPTQEAVVTAPTRLIPESVPSLSARLGARPKPTTVPAVPRAGLLTRSRRLVPTPVTGCARVRTARSRAAGTGTRVDGDALHREAAGVLEEGLLVRRV